MPFKGPGIYEIVPYQVPSLDCNSWGGSTNPGEIIKIADRSKPPGENCQWSVAIAKGSGESAEYYIINVRNGYFLTASGQFSRPSLAIFKCQLLTTCTAAKGSVTCEHRAPTDATVRWNIKPYTTNGYDVWVINSVSDRGQLNVKDGATTGPADVIMWSLDNTDNAKWYFDPVGW